MALTERLSIQMPHGIVYNGFVYTVYSPIDRKAGIEKKVVTLVDFGSGHKTELAQSCSALELQAIDFSSRHEHVAARRKELDKIVIGDAFPGATADDVVALARQLYHITRIFYEEANMHDIPASTVDAYLRKIEEFARTVTLNTQMLEPPKHVESSFDHQSEISAEEIPDELRNRLLDRGPSFQQELAKLFKTFRGGELFQGLRGPAQNYVSSLETAQKLTYPTLNDDLLAAMVSSQVASNGLLYHSWGENAQIAFMELSSRDEAKSEKGIMLEFPDGRKAPYKPKYKCTLLEFNIASEALVNSAIVNMLASRHYDGIDPSMVSSLFPVQFENGLISLGPGNEIQVEVRFPPYAMVDIHNPGFLFLMPEGKFVFKYNMPISAQPLLKSYKVESLSANPYDHFFVSSYGTICGFNPFKQPGGKLPFSQTVWEHYMEALGVLTDGLKGDTGYKSIKIMRDKLAEIPAIVNYTSIPSSYVRREVVEQINKKSPHAKKIHIGDGRIR